MPDTPPGQAVAKPKSPPPYAILADDTYDDSSERTSLKRSYASLVSSSPRSGPAVPVTVRGPLPSPARPSPRKPVARAGPALPAPRPPAPRSTSSSAPGAALSTAAPIGPLPNSCLIPFSRSIYPTCATGSVLHALDGHPVLGGVLASLATSSSPLAAAVGVDLQARKQARAPHVPVATIGILSEVLQGYTRHEQQDAGEVLGAVLQDAVVQAHAPGVLHTTHMERRCLGPTCRSRTLTPATSDVILHVAPSIEAPSSVQAALGSFGSPHHIGLRCGNGCVEGAEQRSVLALLPDSLVVSLARFDSDGRTLNNGLGPVDEQVTLVEDTSGTSAIYDLYSVVAHRGNTMHSGHYVAVCRERDGVVLFDDDSATRHAGFDAAMRKCAAVPYLHLYHRRRVDSDAHAGRSASSSSPMPELPVPPDRFLALNAQSGPAAESATSAVEGVGDTPEAQPLAQPERPSVAGPARSRRRRRSGATRRRSAVANGKDKAPQQQEESDGAFQGSQEDPSNARPSSSTINPSSRINARTTPTKTSSLSHVEYIPVVYRVSSGDFKFTPPVLNDLVNRVRRFTSAALVATGQFGDDQADLERRLTPVFSRRTGRKRVENWRTPSGVPWAYSVERFLAAIKVGDLPVVVLIGSSMPNPLSLRLVASRTSQIVKLRSSDIDSDEHLILDGGRLASILDALFGHLGELSLSPVPTLRELAAAHSHLAQAVETVQDLFDRDTELEVAITTFESFFRRRMSSAWALRLNVQNEVRRFFIGNGASTSLSLSLPPSRASGPSLTPDPSHSQSQMTTARSTRVSPALFWPPRPLPPSQAVDPDIPPLCSLAQQPRQQHLRLAAAADSLRGRPVAHRAAGRRGDASRRRRGPERHRSGREGLLHGRRRLRQPSVSRCASPLPSSSSSRGLALAEQYLRPPFRRRQARDGTSSTACASASAAQTRSRRTASCGARYFRPVSRAGSSRTRRTVRCVTISPLGPLPRLNVLTRPVVNSLRKASSAGSSECACSTRARRPTRRRAPACSAPPSLRREACGHRPATSRTACARSRAAATRCVAPNRAFLLVLLVERDVHAHLLGVARSARTASAAATTTE